MYQEHRRERGSKKIPFAEKTHEDANPSTQTGGERRWGT